MSVIRAFAEEKNERVVITCEDAIIHLTYADATRLGQALLDISRLAVSKPEGSTLSFKGEADVS